MFAKQQGAELDLELPATPQSIGVARRAAVDVALQVGAPETDVALAVSEAVSNAVMHAFRGRDGGTIYVSGESEPGRLTIVVQDDGVGMSPHLDSPGLGFGISLITKMAMGVRFDSTDRGTTVSMSFPAKR